MSHPTPTGSFACAPAWAYAPYHEAKASLMATGWFGPCPHCNGALSYLEGASGSSMSPNCPHCHKAVKVKRSTFLMRDTSGPDPLPTRRPQPKP